MTYDLFLRNYVGGYDFDAEYVYYVLGKKEGQPVNVLIDSLGGSLSTALSISAAFARHGDVTVHLVGMNASAATVATMGAKRVTMDSHAMYLVHQCSIEFFQWADTNSSDLAQIIKDAKQLKSDLEKMDATVAGLYAEKTGMSLDACLHLMKKGGWLTSDEAYDYGFIDEITGFSEDASPLMNDQVAASMVANGIPVPPVFAEKKPSKWEQFCGTLRSLFNSKIDDMEVKEKQELPEEEKVLAETEAASSSEETVAAPAEEPSEEVTEEPSEEPAAPAESGDEPSPFAPSDAEARLAEADAEIARLRAEVESLKSAPGADTTHVVASEEKPSDGYLASRNRAQQLYDLVK